MRIPHIIRSADLAYAWSYQYQGPLHTIATAWDQAFESRVVPLTDQSIFLMPEFQINQIEFE